MKNDNYIESLEYNLSDYISRNAKLFPDKPAIIHPQWISYSSLDKQINQYAQSFVQIGLKKGTYTILLVTASPIFFMISMALLRIGAIPVMIDPGMGISKMINALSTVKATAFIGIPKASLLKYLFPKKLKSIGTYLTVRKDKLYKGLFRKPLEIPNQLLAIPVKMNPNDTAAIFFTSGSTGPPKGVVYNTQQLNAQLICLQKHFNYGPDEIDLCTFPLIGLYSLCLGNSLAIADMDMTHPVKMNPERVISNLRTHNCTQMFCSPMVLKKFDDYLIKNPSNIKSMKRILSAGAPVPASLIESFKHKLHPDTKIHTPYGATEALPICDIKSDVILKSINHTHKSGSNICLGKAIHGNQIKIIEISDTPIRLWKDVTELAPNEVGEIIVNGDLVSTSYFNLDKENDKSKIIDQTNGKRWHRMGDLGSIDEHGLLWFYGRKSHRVILDDSTLFTIPCEAIFNQHKQVRRSALVSFTNPLDKKQAAAIIIELISQPGNCNKKQILNELEVFAKTNPLTDQIHRFFFYKSFPVDPRHNAKINREKLSEWVQKKIR